MPTPADKDPKRVAAGRKGGQANVAKYGAERMRQIAREGGAKGGKTTLARHGREHFRRIGAKGGRQPRGGA